MRKLYKSNDDKAKLVFPAVAHIMAAFVLMGYVKFVKRFEFTGGLAVVIPRLRNVGLLLLGPVIVNIITFPVLIGDSNYLLNPFMLYAPYHLIKSEDLFWQPSKP